MKTTETNRILATLILAFCSIWSFAQEGRTCTVIEVSGNGYSDKVWLFSVAGTTEGFDNGWDGYKFLVSSPAPQIYVESPDGNFQVSTSSDIHKQVVGFIPGDAETYTLTFTHTDLSLTYKTLYIHDRITGKTIDIFAQGSTYTFSTKKSDRRDRFEMLTITNNEVDNNQEKKTDTTTNDNKAKKVKAFSTNRNLVVKNPNKEKAIVRMFNAQNGTFVMEQTIQAESNIEIVQNAQTGAYIIAVSVENDIYNSTILLQ